MVHTTRRHAFAVLGAFAASGALPAAAQTSAFPSRPIRLIVPHAPGGNSDTFGRILAQNLTERIGQQVVVENRPGAGGTVGSAMVSKSAADGYTLVVADNGTHAIAPTLYGAKLNYDVFKDFTPITLAASFPTVIMIHPAVPARTAQEFVALAKSQPGKLTYSSAGTGNGSHLTVELFRAAAGGLDMLHVPYKGGAPAILALLNAEVQLTAVSANTALPHITSGKVRALGVASSKRSPALPDVPTFAESGIAFDGDSWLAIMGPAGIPADVAARLNTEIAATLRVPATQERLAKIGLVVVASPQSGLTEVLQRDVPKWGKAVRDSGAVSDEAGHPMSGIKKIVQALGLLLISGALLFMSLLSYFFFYTSGQLPSPHVRNASFLGSLVTYAVFFLIGLIGLRIVLGTYLGIESVARFDRRAPLYVVPAVLILGIVVPLMIGAR